MYIDLVRPGETLAAVAARTGVEASRLQELNNLESAAVTAGQALIIPSNRYVVQPGDTLWEISRRAGVSTQALQRANPAAARVLRPGQALRVPEPDRRPAEIIGYLPLTDPGVTAADIGRWGIPLTYVAIFAYLIDQAGTLTPVDDAAAIRAARAVGARPLMSIANMQAGGAFSPVIARAIIATPVVRERVISAILRIVAEKGYDGVDSDIENIDVSEREGYVDFLRELKERLGEGRLLTVAVPPKWDEFTFAYARGHDYAGIGRVADRVYLMNYEFHWVGGPPGAIAPLPSVRRALLYAARQMEARKILSGISTTAYDWPLPDTPENRARAWSHQEALAIAIREGVPIRYDPVSETPWFRYRADGAEREVWFEDARSLLMKFQLLREAGVAGTGIWQLGAFSPQFPPLVNALFQVRRA